MQLSLSHQKKLNFYFSGTSNEVKYFESYFNNKDSIRKENHKLISLMNIDTKPSLKILAN